MATDHVLRSVDHILVPSHSIFVPVDVGIGAYHPVGVAQDTVSVSLGHVLVPPDKVVISINPIISPFHIISLPMEHHIAGTPQIVIRVSRLGEPRTEQHCCTEQDAFVHFLLFSNGSIISIYKHQYPCTHTIEPLYFIKENIQNTRGIVDIDNNQLRRSVMQKFNKPLISIAPMIDISNTHFRYFMRLLTKQSTIYTEMLHHNAILHHHDGLLPFHPSEHPIVLQLGGSDPEKLADAAQIGVRYGYDEINLNVGCPSPRVQEGSFGACLMKEPELVYQCMKAMRERLNGVNCTVKCRLGVDEYDSYDFVKTFVGEVSKNGNVSHFIIHARKAFLKGLNPAQNRNVPPLHYDRVYKLKEDFPHLKFTINGGIKTINDAHKILQSYDLEGCMIGRTAFENPYEFIKADSMIYGKEIDKTLKTREQVLLQYADYLDNVQTGGYFNGKGPDDGEDPSKVDQLLGININSVKHHYVNPSVLIKPAINMYHGIPNSSVYRQFLSDPKRLKHQPLSDIIKDAVKIMIKMKKQRPYEEYPQQLKPKKQQSKQQMKQQI